MGMRTSPVNEHKLDSFTVIDLLSSSVKTIQDHVFLHVGLHFVKSTFSGAKEDQLNE